MKPENPYAHWPQPEEYDESDIPSKPFGPRYRSQCNCECHKPGSVVIHFMPCCYPDPEPVDKLATKHF